MDTLQGIAHEKKQERVNALAIRADRTAPLAALTLQLDESHVFFHRVHLINPHRRELMASNRPVRVAPRILTEASCQTRATGSGTRSTAPSLGQE